VLSQPAGAVIEPPDQREHDVMNAFKSPVARLANLFQRSRDAWKAAIPGQKYNIKKQPLALRP
jgi:hypothetical protein